MRVRTSDLGAYLLAPCVMIVCGGWLVGCSSGGPDKAAEAQRLDVAHSYRSYFNKVQGDYDSLTAADKAAFVKLAGGEAAAQKAWNQMKYGPGGAPPAATPDAPIPGSAAASGH